MEVSEALTAAVEVSADSGAAVLVAVVPPAIGKIALTGMQKDLEQLVARLAKANGLQLVSVVLYGSAATGDHNSSYSDLNILSVLKQVTPAELHACEPIFRWWHDLGHPSPLLLSEHEVATSSDCFAIEFQDIQEHHRLLHGKDIVSSLVVDRSFYRAQVERELRSKLLRLRTKAAPILSEKEPLARLLADSVSTFCVLFRHALLLHAVPCHPNRRTIIDQSHKTFAIESAPFLQLLDAREEKIALKQLDPVALLTVYLRELSVVIEAVDRLDK
jgi:hypothetical protein